MAGLRWHDWLLSVGQNGCFYSSANNPDGAAPEGPELAKMRKTMRVTQKKAAAELGLSAATLGHLERGKRRSTKLERRYYELLCELERTLPQTAS